MNNLGTVNLEISRGIYFCETSHMRGYVKIKFSQNGEIILSDKTEFSSYFSLFSIDY